jgi:fibronectin type 3 domain-containing protein
LNLSPASGTNTGTVTAAVNLTGLTAGTYSGAITVSAPGATSKTLPVSFTVNPPTTAGTLSLTWSANTETDLAGYKVYVGTQSGVYGPPITVGKVTAHQLNNLTMNTTYFVSITAVDTAGNESVHSAEVSKSIF